MIFSKSSKSVDLNKLKEENPDAFTKLIDDVKVELGAQESHELVNAKKTIEELTTKTERKEVDAKITLYGEKLKVKEEVMNKINKENLTFEAALVKMVDSHIKNIKDFTESFDDTASNIAGATGASEDDSEFEPKTFAEVIIHIAERDGITKAKAAEKGKIEFKEVFNSQYEGKK